MRYKEEILHYESGETLEQVAQRSCGCPVPGNVQGQVGRGFEQPDLMEVVAAHGKVVGTRSLNFHWRIYLNLPCICWKYSTVERK